MWRIAKKLKRKVKRWQSGALKWGEFFVSFASILLVGFFMLAIGLPTLCMVPLIVVAVIAATPLIVALWEFKLKSLHPLVRQLGSHDEQKRREAFQQLLEMGDEAIPLFIQAFNAPVEMAPYEDWCGFWANRLAVEGLGRLKAKSATKVLIDALKHKDAGVVEKAAWALGEIGADEATPDLLPLLAYEANEWTNAQEDSVRQSAKVALEKLGKGELVDAILQLLGRERDQEAIERVRDSFLQYRSAIVKALLVALKGRNTFAATQAAWALGKLNAVEALPVLEKLANSFRTPYQVRQSCQEAASWLRTIATLPSPANLTNIITENLPAIPDPNSIPTDTLPRPATPSEEGD